MLGKFAASAVLALTALIGSAPASAQTFDAFSSFNATQGSGGFSYGSFDGTNFTEFTQNSDCVISGTTCLRGAGAGLPGIFKSDGTQATSGTVILPIDRLIAHPGEFAESLYVAWTAPFAGTFNYTVQLSQQDTNTAQHSVGVTEFLLPTTGAVQLFSIATIDQSLPSLITGYSATLAAGDRIGYIIDKNGNYFNDSTGINFSVTAAVPEPATWAMMILGFGVVGGTMRRRSSAKAALA